MENKNTDALKYQPCTDADIKRLSPGAFVANAVVGYTNPLNKKERIKSKFAIYDGVGFSEAIINGKKVEIMATFPLTRFINFQAKPMKEKIKKVLKITEDRDVTAVEILQTYGKMVVIS